MLRPEHRSAGHSKSLFEAIHGSHGLKFMAVEPGASLHPASFPMPPTVHVWHWKKQIAYISFESDLKSYSLQILCPN